MNNQTVINPITLSAKNRIKRILFPIDLTHEFQQGLRYAVALARCYEAELFLFHSLDESLPDGGTRLREYFQELMEPFQVQSNRPLTWQGIIGEGNAGVEITSAATKYQIDLVVMQSRRRPIAAAVFGSTAELVCRTSPCPVMIVHPHKQEWINEHNGDLTLKRVLVGYDYSHFADLALACGVSLAKEFDCELHILRVLPIDSQNAWRPASTATLQTETENLLNRIAPDIRAQINILPVIAEGQPLDEILSYSKTHNIELICLGNHSESERKLLGSTVDRVLREANCPVLVACPLTWNLTTIDEPHNSRVLIAFDGSHPSELALREAIDRNWPAGTEIRVISVMEALSTLGPSTTHYRLPGEVYNALEKIASQAAESLAGAGRKVSYIVRSGMAAETIIKESTEWQADRIIIGTHSRRGLSHLLLGSVAEEVVKMRLAR